MCMPSIINRIVPKGEGICTGVSLPDIIRLLYIMIKGQFFQI